jgi:[acyl-carrier-protein] S-malonyltransferase
MGQPWRATSGWALVEHASDVLGQNVAELLLTDDADRLARTRDAQVAVFVTSLVAWENAPLDDDDDDQIVALAGHSLGQLTALVAAGALAFDEGLQLVARRAELTQTAADATPGRMVALLGATIEQAEAACAAVTPTGCWIANDNAPGQVVLAGTPDGVDAAVAAATELGVRKAMPLKVGGAFHTPLMASACAPFADALASVVFKATTAPIVRNDDAIPHRDPEGWREKLVDHLVSPVRWRESQLALEALGASTFVEVSGPGTLAGMAKRTVPSVQCRVFSEPRVGART